MFPDDVPRPSLYLRIINPHKNLHTEPILAQIDTGSDMCCFPSDIAIQLGHELESVEPVTIITPSGEGIAFPHTTVLEILEKEEATGEPGERVLYTTDEKLIHFVKNGKDFYLGVEDFLEEFVLNINYPYRIFSITHP